MHTLSPVSRVPVGCTRRMYPRNSFMAKVERPDLYVRSKIAQLRLQDVYTPPEYFTNTQDDQETDWHPHDNDAKTPLRSLFHLPLTIFPKWSFPVHALAVAPALLDRHWHSLLLSSKFEVSGPA